MNDPRRSTARQNSAIALSCLGLACFGIVYWQLVDAFLPLALLLLGVFCLGPLPRWAAYALASSFYLAQTSPFIAVGGLFFEGSSPVGLGWLAHGLAVSMPVLFLHGQHPGRRAALLALLYIVPPLGLWMPSSPAIAIGLLFPNTGLLGLILFIGTGATLASVSAWAFGGRSSRPRRWRIVHLALPQYVMWAALGCQLLVSPPPLPPTWHSFNTNIGRLPGSMEGATAASNLLLPNAAAARLAASDSQSRPQVWFFGEGVLNERSAATDVIWASKLEHSGVLAVGGTYFVADYQSRTAASGVFALGDLAAHPQTAIPQNFSASQTFPVTMWAPWLKSAHFPAHSPNSPVSLSGVPTHFSFCYESQLIWPHIVAAASNARTMVSLENRWGTQGTSLEHAQNASARLVARWLNLPLLTAINR